MYVPGWPGAHHSVGICEGLEEWSGGQDAFHPSDTEEEAVVQLVRQDTLFGEDENVFYCTVLFTFSLLAIINNKTNMLDHN